MKNQNNKYPEYIMKQLRQVRFLEENDRSEDEDINEMSQSEAFCEVCQWDGLIGYDERIKGWIKDIYNIDLDEIVSTKS